MADWEYRSETEGDVVFFRYAGENLERAFSEVYVWDLDKTYLDTSWASLSELWRTALEKAFQKKNIPGTATLVRALRSGWEDNRGQLAFPIYFITASPPQMEEKIEQKLTLDDIKPLGAFYKDNLRNWKPSRWWRLTKQVGFKVQALLQLRTRLKDDVRQILWGDDSESDAIIYSLYSDICARRWTEKELIEILSRLHVIGEQTETILDLQDQIPKHDPVEKIYINLATDTDPEYYLKFGRRCVPTVNSLQAALDLFQDSRLSASRVLEVARDMRENYGITREAMEASVDGLVRRQILGQTAVGLILPELASHGFVSPDFKTSVEPRPVEESRDGRVYRLEGTHEAWIPDGIDYLHESR
ncbi:MAG: phosphatase domain-containing protein [Bdellovibrionales bacterium]|nr:phosphatase domain-containing protein [Bdellovibrionales bacterium]